MDLTTSQKLTLAALQMNAALDPEQPPSVRLRRVRWVLKLLRGLGEE